MAILRREARDLMSRGYEMGATVLNGTVARGVDGTWTIDGRPLEQVLGTLEGQEVALVVSSISDEAGTKHVCPLPPTNLLVHYGIAPGKDGHIHNPVMPALRVR